MRASVGSSFFFIGQQLMLNAIGIPAMAYIIRTLGPVGYGQWSVAMALIATTSVLANLGLRTVFVRDVAQNPEAAEERLAEQLGLRALLSLAACAVALLVCWALRYPPVVLACTGIAALGLCVTTVGGTLGDLLQGFHKIKTFAAINFAAGVVLTVASVLLMWRHAGPVGLSVAYLVGPLVSLAAMWLVVRREICPVRLRWNPARYRELLREVRMLCAHQMLGSVRDRVEALLLPRLAGIGEFAYFAAGSIPADRLGMVSDGLNATFYPAVSRAYKEDREAAAEQVAHLIAISLIVSIPLSVLLSFLAGPVAELLFPGRAEVCREVMRVTVWVLPVLAVLRPMGYSLQAAGRHSEGARAGMKATVVSLIVSVGLVALFGVRGACWSLITRSVIWALFLLPLFAEYYPGVFRGVPLARIAACSAVMALILWGAVALNISGLLAVTLAGGLASAIYLGSLVALQLVNIAPLAARLKGRLAALGTRG